ncbi:MAG: hypothetical protein ACE5E4_00465 [Candidatus Binatia bacterium]
MKRLLRMFSLLLLLMAVALGWRIARVLSIQPPTFGLPQQVSPAEPLPPRPRQTGSTGPIIKAILEGNLFETERGYREEAEEAVTEAPLPPPTNVLLTGIMFVDGEPVAIMSDTKVGNTQLSLRKGDMIGSYEVGEVGSSSVVLLGPGGQQFAVGLQVRKGPGVGAPRPATSARRGTTVAPVRAATARGARPGQGKNPRQGASAVHPPARTIPRGRPAANTTQNPAAPTPAQARLEALKKLREAASRAR